MTFQSDLFAGRGALVTGGTSGIGAAIAAALAACGAIVTVSGRQAASVTQFNAQRLPNQNAVQLDVTDNAAIKALISGFERLDIVVNSAGLVLRQREYEPDAFAQVVDVNLNGSMRVAEAARPLLAKQGGSIVNIASMLSFFGGAHAPAYSASKGGVVQLTKSLAIRYAPENIRVNAIAPGWIITKLTQAVLEDKARSDSIVRRTPMGRWGKPEEIGGAAVFLCSPAAAFITGVTLPVDGGYLVV